MRSEIRVKIPSSGFITGLGIGIGVGVVLAIHLGTNVSNALVMCIYTL